MIRKLLRFLFRPSPPPCALCQAKAASTGWYTQPIGTVFGRCADCSGEG